MARLLILWLLSEGPGHGYRLKRILDEPSLRFWLPVEVGSIYAALASLVKGGFVRAEAVEREGLRPERTRYRITPEGRKHLQEQLRRAWTEPPRQGDLLQAALAARSELPESEVEALLRKRLDTLRSLRDDLERAAPGVPDIEMAERRRCLLVAEIAWAEGALRRAQGERDNGKGKP